METENPLQPNAGGDPMGMPLAATSPRQHEVPVPADGDDASREIARKTERENPQWIVVFGIFTKEFVCFPRFPVPPGTILVAQYPGALPGRMRVIERAMRTNTGETR